MGRHHVGGNMQEVAAVEGNPGRDIAALHGTCSRDTLGDRTAHPRPSRVDHAVPGVLSLLGKLPRERTERPSATLPEGALPALDKPESPQIKRSLASNNTTSRQRVRLVTGVQGPSATHAGRADPNKADRRRHGLSIGAIWSSTLGLPCAGDVTSANGPSQRPSERETVTGRVKRKGRDRRRGRQSCPRDIASCSWSLQQHRLLHLIAHEHIETAVREK